MLKFDLDTKRLQVQIGSGDNAPIYTLMEMTQAQRDAYFDAVEPKMRRDAAGKVIGVSKQENILAELLTRCLTTAEGKPVPIATIQSWPTQTVQSLHREAQKLNGLRDEEKKEAEEKNASAM